MRSPPARATFHDRLGTLSSSPSFPDLQDLIATKTKPRPPTLRSGSAAAPIPENASTAFTSASDLLRIARATGNDSLDVLDEPVPPVANKASITRVRKTAKEPTMPTDSKRKKTSKPRKASNRVAKEVIILSSDGISPELTRHVDSAAFETAEQSADTTGMYSDEGTPLHARPWKRFKAPTSPVQAEMGEAETASAKPLAKAKSQKKKGKSETVSRHFPQAKGSVEPPKSEAREKRTRVSTPEATNLETAVQRRADWTPPKPDTLVPTPSSDLFDSPDDFPLAHANDTGSDSTNLFKNLRDTYGHKVADEGIATASKPQNTKVLGKRKAIELVSVSLASKTSEASWEVLPGKVKAPKKKPRTITELATAAYAPKVTEDDRRDDSLLDYFGVEDHKHDALQGAVVKGKGKDSKTTKSKKKAAPPKSMLLSPQSAMRQSAAQDFVFGTASQLAHEKSPTFLRDLHAAMKASTVAEEDDRFGSPSFDGSLKPKMHSKGLWSVSARDGEGELVDVEIIDMIDSPTLPQDDAILDPWKQLPPEAAGVEDKTADSSVIEIDSRPVATKEAKSSSQAPLPQSHLSMTQKMTLSTAAAISPISSNESFPLVTNLLEDEMPPPSNQQQTQEGVRESPSRTAAHPQKPRPDYETFTDVKLAKEISRFGFKAVKTRVGMIALLDQCWKRKSQASVAGASFSTSSVLASPNRKQTEVALDPLTKTPSPAKKSRGKTKATAKADINIAKASTKGLATAEVPAPLKKKPGRPRKAATIAAEAALSISPPPKLQPIPSTPRRKKAASRADDGMEDLDLDSEIEASGSTPEQLFSPCSADADLTISEDTEISLNLSPSAQQFTLFAHITKAVTSAPRTTDPKNPSWHEKMLMYDPIILEDLTAWLNSGELTKLGYEYEVMSGDVKKWCESKSICCLWKSNWRGQERKRL